MIELLDYRPQETMCITENGDCAWHALKVDKTAEIYGWLGVSVVDDTAGLHLIFNRSIVGVFRQVEKDWERLRASLRDYGIKTLVASNPNIEDKRWPKLIKRFGFPEPRLIYLSTMEV